jgi:hypothetical protein
MGLTMKKRLQAISFPDGTWSRKHAAAVAAIVVAVALVAASLWAYEYATAAHSQPTRAADLSHLFKDGPGRTMDGAAFADLRDPACKKSFPLTLTERVYVRMSRNCRYEIHVDSGRVSANFLNSGKGVVEIAPGRSWSATDFWSLNPLSTEARVRIEPTS